MPIICSYFQRFSFFKFNFCTLLLPLLHNFLKKLNANLVKGDLMKLIIAVIKPFKLDDIRDSLKDIGVQGLMVSEVKGYGRQDGHSEIYRGAEYTVSFVPKLKLELVLADKDVSKAVDTISEIANSGKIGDGKIFVLPVESAVRIRTGEKNEDAI